MSTAPASFAPVLVVARADRARQVAWAGRGPALLENRDLLTTVWLGSDEGMDPGGSDTIPLDPLGSKALDGRDVWAMTQAGTAVVANMPGGTSSQVSPLLIAQQLGTTGLPLTHGVRTTYGNQSVTLAHGSAVTLSSMTGFMRPGYVLRADANYPSGTPTNPFWALEFVWNDPSGNFRVGHEQWIMPMTAAGATYRTFGRGPSKGDLLTLIATNLDTVVTITLNVIVLDCTYSFTRDDWRAVDNAAVAGYTTPPGTNMQQNVMLSTSGPAIFPAGTTNYLLPVYSGMMSLSAQAAAAGVSLTVFPATLPGDNVYSAALGAGVPLNNALIPLGRKPYVLQVVNTGAATGSWLSAVALEYSS